MVWSSTRCETTGPLPSNEGIVYFISSRKLTSFVKQINVSGDGFRPPPNILYPLQDVTLGKVDISDWKETIQ